MSRPCRGNTSRLVALLDGALRPKAADRVRAHLDGCAACRESLRRLEATRGVLGRMADDEPEVNYRQVETQIHWQLSKTGSHRAMRGLLLGPVPVVGLAVLALVLGGVLGAWLERRHGAEISVERAEISVERSPVAVHRPAVARKAKAKAPPNAPAVAAHELAALVTLIKGQVRVATADGIIGPLDLSRPLLAGERVMTDARGAVALQWAEGCGIRLGGGSEVRLARLDQAGQRVELLRGGVDAQYRRGARGERTFAVVGGGIRAEVRGTRFAVVLGDDHSTEVTVRKGRVAVSSLGERWRDAGLPARYGAKVASDGTLEVPGGHRLRVVASRATVTALDKRPPLLALNLQQGWTNLHRVLASTGALLVESRPADADVLFNSLPVGQTNLELRGAVGRHLVELYRGGRLLRRQWIQIGLERARAQVSVDTRAISVRRAGLSPGILDVFRSRAVQIRACYERRLKRWPKLAGRLRLRVKIDAEGQVTDARLDANTLGDAQVGQCAVAAVRRWRFPAGKATEVVYPIVLRPAR